MYVNTINKYLLKGHAPKMDLFQDKRSVAFVWLLPRHSVSLALKPLKVHLVFGCGSMYKGVSLSSKPVKIMPAFNLCPIVCLFRILIIDRLTKKFLPI